MDYLRLTYKQAAAILGCSVETITRRVKMGDIPSWPTGKRKRCINWRVFMAALRSVARDDPDALTEEAAVFLRETCGIPDQEPKQGEEG